MTKPLRQPSSTGVQIPGLLLGCLANTATTTTNATLAQDLLNQVDFLRVYISGENSQSDKPKLNVFLRQALRLREMYMAQSWQSFPEMTKAALHKSYTNSDTGYYSPFCDEPTVLAVNDPFDITFPENLNCLLKMENGVIQVYRNGSDLRESISLFLLLM